MKVRHHKTPSPGTTPESDNSKMTLTSDDYLNSATLLTHKVFEIVRSGRDRGWVPPFRLHVTGVDGDEVVDLLIDQTGEMQLIGASHELTLAFR
ncbi:MAG: hypothetical protein DMG76_11770 [Acidobacteria bacterium]|nr:MAG: hypothetical protein DMG76_11770 [Acidobacteriota bacterium]